MKLNITSKKLSSTLTSNSLYICAFRKNNNIMTTLNELNALQLTEDIETRLSLAPFLGRSTNQIPRTG
jgi:hypothetical protein